MELCLMGITFLYERNTTGRAAAQNEEATAIIAMKFAKSFITMGQRS